MIAIVLKKIDQKICSDQIIQKSW